MPGWAQLASFPFGKNWPRAWLDRPSESAPGGNETSYVTAPVAGQPHVFLRFSVPDEET